MKKYDIWKKLQLAIMLVITGVSVYLAVSDQHFYQDIQGHPQALWIFIIMWILLLLVYIFLFVDFFFLARLMADYCNISSTAYEDKLSGIPNRFSCDVVLEKYKDTSIPANMACVMLEIDNLDGTNLSLGHEQGDMLIKEFSNILSNAALALCFVGRNGGNKFLAIFEECTGDQLDIFLGRIATRVADYNHAEPVRLLSYHFGVATNAVEQIQQVQGLVAVANSRLYE